MFGGNPVFDAKSLRTIPASENVGNAMTVEGAVHKTFVLLFIFLCSAFFVAWRFYSSLDLNVVYNFSLTGLIGGVIAGFLVIAKKEQANIYGSIYAFFQGLAVGGVSVIFEVAYPGIILQTVGLTVTTLICMLGIYRFRIIKVTQRFRIGIAAAVGAIMMIYVLDIILRLFFKVEFPYLHDNGLEGIAFSLIIVAIAALTLLLDFDFIEQGAEKRLPKYLEWYAAFGLLASLLWLYLEILRLLAKTRSRRS